MTGGRSPRVLLLCYGNPGRLDDGLGPAFGAEIERARLPGVDVEVNYQLNVEDIKTAADHEVVLFVDASTEGGSLFTFRPVRPRANLSFSSHSLEPEQVLAFARDLFNGEPRGYALGILGYEFDDFGERLSPRAQANLALAVGFMLPVLREGSFSEASAGLAPGG